MKSRLIKRITAIISVSLAGILVFGIVKNSMIVASAGETLIGIETLVQQVQERQSPYRILEVVPEETAAEIGYLISEQEPVLSQRTAGSGEWEGWKQGLEHYGTAQERTNYMTGLSVKLQQFYDSRGFTADNAPVIYQPYEESDTPKQGYVELAFETQSRKGYFQSYAGVARDRYALRFGYVGYYTDSDVTDSMAVQYYSVKNVTQVTENVVAGLQNSAQLYRFYDVEGSQRFEYAGTWGELKSTVSGGDSTTVSGGSAGVVSGGNAGGNSGGAGTLQEFYLVSFERWTQGMMPSYPALYAVNSMDFSENGEYEFVEEDGAFETSFARKSIYYKGGFVNNEWFRTNALDMGINETESFPVEVITLTPTELNALAKVPDYDLLYLNCGDVTLAGSSWVAYSSSNDISAQVREELFRNTISEGLPCIVDSAILNEQLQGTNIHMLGAMFSQKSPMQFYLDYKNGEAVTAQELLDGMYEDTDGNFVVEQVYCYATPVRLVSPDFAEAKIYRNGVGVAGMEKGFGAVLDEITSENLNREANAPGTVALLSTDVSRASVLRHIMNYQNRRQVDIKYTIRVLDIEPAVTDAGSYELTEADVRKWAFGTEEVDSEALIVIDRLTMAEFIGRIESISEVYDLVYIGTDRDHMNVDENGETVFNDSAMNGLIYYHTGDLRYGAMELAGQLDTEYVDGDRSKNVYYYNPVRYGGNDLTVEKKEALLSFLKASFPIIVSDECFETTIGSDGSSVRTISQFHIDNSSNMYEFLQKAIEVPNFYARSDIGTDSGMFQFYLNRPKVNLTNARANGTVNENGIYDIYPSENGRYQLEFRFTIENKGVATVDTPYRCQLYVDVNADGKYSDSEELEDITVLQNGTAVNANQLVAGKEYVVRRYVPEGYKGVLPWKVQVTQTNNSYIHNGMTGYTKLKGLNRERLKIMQICRDKVTEVDWWQGSNEILFNLESRIADPNDIYHVLIYGGTFEGVYYKGIYEDFDIDVTFMTISQFEDAFLENSQILEDYNMLILGFSDAYGNMPGTKDSGPTSAVIRFIESGKSVLFAHDTVSYFNYENGKRGVPNRNVPAETFLTIQYHNSYNLTRYIRGMVGMDLYGITSYEPLKAGRDLNSSSDYWNTLLSRGKDIAYVPRSNRTKAYGLTQGYTYSIINAKDIRWDSEIKQTYTPEETGLTQNFTNTYLNLNYGTVYYHDGTSDQGEIPGNYNGEVSNLWVTQVNRGQITEYPYRLAEEFKVSNTHGQYYQLDFNADDDKDGQSDLVVWYCLGYRTNGEGTRQETIYSMSPNDVSNNYYIYNKGNITYTGMGHAGNASTVDEAKLFINTMIASYNAGIKDPEIATLSDATGNAKEINSVNRYSDDANNLDFEGEENSEADSRYEKVFFRVDDLNFVKGTRRISLNCYYEVPAQTQDALTIAYGGKDIPVKSLDRTIYNASNNEEADTNNLVSGRIYYLLIDKNVMGDYGSKFSVYLEAQSTITSYDKVLQTGKRYKRFDFTKVHLFDLE